MSQAVDGFEGRPEEKAKNVENNFTYHPLDVSNVGHLIEARQLRQRLAIPRQHLTIRTSLRTLSKSSALRLGTRSNRQIKREYRLANILPR